MYIAFNGIMPAKATSFASQPTVTVNTRQRNSDRKRSFLSESSNKITATTSYPVGFVSSKKPEPPVSPQSVIEAAVQEVENETVEEMKRSWQTLSESLQGAKLDSLIMLIATSAVIPIFKKLDTSPIVGFMLAGAFLGPLGLNWIRDLHLIHMLGELGIVFFLFEMGLELSLERLKAMKKDVFGLGTSQFFLTSIVGTIVSLACGLSPAAAVTIGGSLSLSSSAFVLQLLKDKNAMGTRHGKASFGILLLQDLAVVPLLVVVELLSRGGTGLGRALAVAGVKALVTLSAMSIAPKVAAMLFSMILGKATIITLLSRAFGVPMSNAIQTGLLNSQGGEFSFVAFGIAERMHLISPTLTKLLLTTVALSMAITPMLESLGAKIASKMESSQ
eukprot:gene18840-19156_t